MVNVTGGGGGAGIGGGARWTGGYGTCGDIVINGGQVTVRGGSDAPGIGQGYNGTASGTLTLDWTNPTDFVYSNTYSMPSITFGKDFLLSGTDTKATSTNIGGQKIVPYVGDAVTLTDGESYTFTSSFAVNSATYRKTLGEDCVGKHQAWLVPFNYTITTDDTQKFDFYKINMIANAPAPSQNAGDDIWVFLKKIEAGAMLHANMPYVYRPKEAVTDYAFTTENATLKAKQTGAIATMQTMEDTYNIFGTYEPTTATAQDTFYYVNTEGQVAYGDAVTVGAFRWIMRVESKFGSPNAAYGRRVIFFDGEDGEENGVTGISDVRSLMPDGTGEFYDLQGRKVKQPKNGLYIQNGRKVIVK